jgi:hypothetical protein
MRARGVNGGLGRDASANRELQGRAIPRGPVYAVGGYMDPRGKGLREGLREESLAESSMGW